MRLHLESMGRKTRMKQSMKVWQLIPRRLLSKPQREAQLSRLILDLKLVLILRLRKRVKLKAFSHLTKKILLIIPKQLVVTRKWRLRINPSLIEVRTKSEILLMLMAPPEEYSKTIKLKRKSKINSTLASKMLNILGQSYSPDLTEMSVQLLKTEERRMKMISLMSQVSIFFCLTFVDLLNCSTFIYHDIETDYN